MECTTSADSTERSISVTSSGRSPTNNINNLASGLFVLIAFAISLSNDV